MADPEGAMAEAENAVDILGQWRFHSSRQEDLIKTLLAENTALRTQLEDTESDNFTMKTTIRTLRKDAEYAKSLTEELKAKINESNLAAENLEAQRNLVLTLVDGDGYIFHSDLLRKGEEGGREAATQLTLGINEHLSVQASRSRLTLWTMIFLSKERLEFVLNKTGTCTSEQFKLFINGFSQANPLFSFIEVGANKEAADYKIREHLTEFITNPKIYKVILGVDHDNGYGAALSASLAAGNQSRLILLKAHKIIAAEIEKLPLETAYIEGLFLDEKLVVTPASLSRSTGSYARAAAASPSPSISSTTSVMSPKSSNAYVIPGKRDSSQLLKRDPAPCNHLYLIGQCTNSDCSYGHDYALSDQELEQLANQAKQKPCKYTNEGQGCYLVNCIYGHKCPRGRQCPFYPSGKCWFKGRGMHDE